jgi:hypothetical protein
MRPEPKGLGLHGKESIGKRQPDRQQLQIVDITTVIFSVKSPRIRYLKGELISECCQTTIYRGLDVMPVGMCH